jgi:hypothetical protein
MRLAVVALVACCAAAPAFARSLEGTVREAGTRRPVPGAVVTVSAGAQSVELVTDDVGAFVLPLADDTRGSVVVEVDTSGYEHLADSVTLRTDRATTTVDLYVRALPTGETKVRERRSKDAVARGAHRIEGNEVNELPGTYGDPAKAIENFPGMGRVLLSQGSLFIRGAGPNESAVYVDDYEIPDLYHFTGSTSVINIPFVESVELVPGAFSARYGRSTGGIVVLRTKKLPTDDVHGFAKADVIDAGAYVGVPVAPNIAVGASARRSYLDALRGVQIAARGTGNDVVLVPTYWDYQLKLDWDTAPGHELVVFAFGSGDREHYVADGRGAIDAYNRDNDSDFHRLSLRYAHGIGAGVTHTLTVVAGVDDARLDEQGGLRAKKRDSADVQLRDEWTWRTTSVGRRPTKLTAGFDGTARYDGWRYGGFLADTGLLELPTPDLEGSVLGRSAEQQAARATGALYVEGTLEPTDTIVLVPGLRLDGMLLDGPDGMESHLSVEPRVAATWQLAPHAASSGWGTLLRAGGGATSRPPDQEEVAAARDAGVSLKPQRALSMQGGIEQSLGENLSLSSTLYTIWRDELTTRSRAFPVPDRPGFLPVTGGGSGHSTGAEFLLRMTLPQRAFAWVTYSIARHERTDRDDANNPVTVDHVYLSPSDTTHLLGVVGQVQLPWNLRAGARYRVASGMPDTQAIGGLFDADTGRYDPVFAPVASTRFPLFQALDVRLDWTTTFSWFALTCYADLVNVLNLRAQEGTLYNHDFSETQPRLGLPTIPAIGAKATF